MLVVAMFWTGLYQSLALKAVSPSGQSVGHWKERERERWGKREGKGERKRERGEIFKEQDSLLSLNIDFSF